jgi:hypothetical protein
MGVGHMEIRYASKLLDICWVEISGLFEAVGWEKSLPEI